MNFQIILAVGTILEVSKYMDMIFTWKHEICWLHVLVVDPNLIPQYINVFIGDYMYELRFWVEGGSDRNDHNPIALDFMDNGDADAQREDGMEEDKPTKGKEEEKSAPRSQLLTAATSTSVVRRSIVAVNKKVYHNSLCPGFGAREKHVHAEVQELHGTLVNIMERMDGARLPAAPTTIKPQVIIKPMPAMEPTSLVPTPMQPGQVINQQTELMEVNHDDTTQKHGAQMSNSLNTEELANYTLSSHVTRIKKRLLD